MSQPLSLLFDATIHEGQVPKARRAASELVRNVKENEPRTLVYRCFVDEASRRLCFFDTYASNEAFMEHLDRPEVGAALQEILGMADLNAFTILGDVSPEVRERAGAMGATFVAEHEGFERQPITPGI